MDANFSDDEFFSDADLDDLPANTLNELERRAIASTQHVPPVSTDCPLNLDEYPPPNEEELDVETLQARILELEHDQRRLQRAAEDAHSAALSKAGEIAIVRANHEKTTKEYDRRMTDILQIHANETAKQKAELDALRKEREKMETEKRFLEHDLVQQTERTRAVKKNVHDGQDSMMRGKESAQSSPAGTPSKRRIMPFRDGFDDDEVMLMSPTKAKDRIRPGTPRAGTKRKRVLSIHSPGAPLLFDEPEKSAATQSPALVTETTSFKSAIADSKGEIFQLVRTLVSHHSEPSAPRTLELLTKFVFPSAAHLSLASLIYDKLAQLPFETSLRGCSIGFCQMLLTLLERCLAEKYYTPLFDITNLLQHLLMVSSESLSSALIPQLVPLTARIIDLIALPIAKAIGNPNKEMRPSQELMGNIDTLDYFDVLHLTALNACLIAEELALFWSNLELDHILLWLSRSQPLAQITITLQLLATSILPDSFGPIIENHSTTHAPQQYRNETTLIDRLLNLFFETPEVPPEEEPYTAVELLHLRIDVLGLLKQLCSSQHGGRLLATHNLAVGRLVRLLHDSVLAMYSYKEETHSLNVSLVNNCVLLLAHLTSCHRDVIDMRARLGAVPSGVQKHLVALSRIAFSEGLSVLENGIDPEAAEAAHRMLDEHLSPEEGDAVVEIFSSAR